jgi:hypothetical protein
VSYQYCEGCEDIVAVGDERHGPCGSTYCDYCFNERYTYCSGCDEYADSDDIRFPEDGNDPLCETCYADAYDICGSCCGEAAIGTLIEGPDRTDRCESCHVEEVTVCEECSDEVMSSDAAEGLCTDCVESQEVEEEEEYEEAEAHEDAPTPAVPQSSYGAVADTATTYTRQEEEAIIWCTLTTMVPKSRIGGL